jgi:hypothetical protein
MWVDQEIRPGCRGARHRARIRATRWLIGAAFADIGPVARTCTGNHMKRSRFVKKPQIYDAVTVRSRKVYWGRKHIRTI